MLTDGREGGPLEHWHLNSGLITLQSPTQSETNEAAPCERTGVQSPLRHSECGGNGAETKRRSVITYTKAQTREGSHIHTRS